MVQNPLALGKSVAGVDVLERLRTTCDPLAPLELRGGPWPAHSVAAMSDEPQSRGRGACGSSSKLTQRGEQVPMGVSSVPFSGSPDVSLEEMAFIGLAEEDRIFGEELCKMMDGPQVRPSYKSESKSHDCQDGLVSATGPYSGAEAPAQRRGHLPVFESPPRKPRDLWSYPDEVTSTCRVDEEECDDSVDWAFGSEGDADFEVLVSLNGEKTETIVEGGSAKGCGLSQSELDCRLGSALPCCGGIGVCHCPRAESLCGRRKRVGEFEELVETESVLKRLRSSGGDVSQHAEELSSSPDVSVVDNASVTTDSMPWSWVGRNYEGNRDCCTSDQSGLEGEVRCEYDDDFRGTQQECWSSSSQANVDVEGEEADTSSSVTARESRNRKIKETVMLLREVIPGGSCLDADIVLDEAIQYVKMLQEQVQALGARRLARMAETISS